MNFEILTSYHSALAEGPLYHADEDAVYWVDIESGKLHRYSLPTGTAQTVHEGSKIGGLTIQEDGSLLLFRAQGAIHHWNAGDPRVLIEHLEEELATRFNDVAADPEGRVFCGTLPNENRRGRLYRFDPDRSIRVVLEDLGCSNGIGWSPDLETMYVTDSTDKTIFAFSYDRPSGEITNRRTFYFHEAEGVPDGMTVDADGNLWVAVWGGGCVLQLGPDGKLLQRFAAPAQKVTCPTFGGKALDELYVTTAGGRQQDEGSGAGELLRLRPGVKGRPEFRSRVSVQVPV